MPTVRVRIKKTGPDAGSTKIETEGFKGESCLEATEALRNRLGEQVGEIDLKDEYFETEDQVEEELL